jgi:hypothetical protein
MLSYDKGDLVYLYDPVAKRGKAKKFAYNYTGPYEVVARISPLIYEIEGGEGKVVVVHVNRHKKVHRQRNEIVQVERSLSKRRDRSVELSASRENETPTESVESTDVDATSIPSRSRGQFVQEGVRDEVVESSPAREDPTDPGWTPGTRYFRRKGEVGRTDRIEYRTIYVLERGERVVGPDQGVSGRSGSPPLTEVGH